MTKLNNNNTKSIEERLLDLEKNQKIPLKRLSFRVNANVLVEFLQPPDKDLGFVMRLILLWLNLFKRLTISL